MGTHSNRIEKNTHFEVAEIVYFRRTNEGHNEHQHQHRKLRTALRRLLAMIHDGQTVEELAYFVRSHELPALLNELLSMQLIEIGSDADVEAPNPEFAAWTPQPAMTPMQFEALRRAVLHSATELLGDFVRPHLNRLYACADSGELRGVIDNIRDQISQTLGAHEAQSFIDNVRASALVARKA